MDRIEQLMREAKPRVGAAGTQSREATLPARSYFPRIQMLSFLEGALRHDEMPCGPRPRLYWPPQPSSAR